MRSIILPAALALAVSAPLFAGEKPAKKPAAKSKLHCAVMKSHEVDIQEATKKKAYADYNGNRYFFCCAGCLPEFKKNPAKFAKSDHIPTPKPAKKG